VKIIIKLITILFFIWIFTPSIAQSIDDMKNKDVIARNKIKNQINWDYYYTGDKISKTGTKTSVTTYTTSGDIFQVSAYNNAGQVVNVEKYNYDTRGNKIEYTRNSADNSYQKKWVYNDKNLLIEESGFDGVENFRNTYGYNEKAEMTEIRYLKQTVLREKRLFNKNGNTTTVSVYNSGGIITSQVILKYDISGNLAEETVYGVNQNELEKKTYNYDAKENLKEEAKYKLDKITLKTNYTYNNSGNLVEIAEESAGAPKFVKKTLTYDDKGNLIQIKWRRKGADEFNTISYNYDAKGLCISAETYYPATKYKVLTKYTYENY
jgi:hypothetical protein